MRKFFVIIFILLFFIIDFSNINVNSEFKKDFNVTLKNEFNFKNLNFVLNKTNLDNNYERTNHIEIDIDNEYIYVSKKELKLFYKDKCYTVSLGSEKHPTPNGIGYIYEKRKNIVFRYSSGVLKGNIITHYTTTNGEKKLMPYSKMRALGIIINNEKRYSIHSTTEDWRLGQFVSKGCIRMRIDDMLELYEKVKVGTLVIIED